MTTHATTALNHRRVLAIAGPMMLANLSTPLLGMVDTAVVGHLSDAYFLGAVAIGSLIFTFVFWGFGFLRMATTGLTAQAYGQQNTQAMQQALSQASILAIAIAAVLLLCQTPIVTFALHWIEASAEVEQYARTYFAWRIWGTPATLLNYALIGYLIGREASRSALWVILSINLSNILLDVVLVLGFNLDVRGVALASVIAEGVGLGVGCWALKRLGVHWPSAQAWRLSARALQSLQHLRLHGNLMIRTFCLIFAFAVFTAQGAKQGDIVLAANAVLLHFLTLLAFVMDGFANATEVLSGQAIGQRNRRALRRALVLTGLWSLLGATGFVVLYGALGTVLIGWMTSIEAVRAAAVPYLTWLVFAPWVAMWAYWLDGLFIGAMRSLEMRNTMLFATGVCYLPAIALLEPLGNHGLWLSLMVFLAARGLSQWWYVGSILRLEDPPPKREAAQ